MRAWVSVHHNLEASDQQEYEIAWACVRALSLRERAGGSVGAYSCVAAAQNMARLALPLLPATALYPPTHLLAPPSFPPLPRAPIYLYTHWLSRSLERTP